MILESISIKPNAISKFMPFLNYLEVKVKGQGHFGSNKVKKCIKCGTWPVFTRPKENVVNLFMSSMTGTSVMDYCNLWTSMTGIPSYF